MKLLKFYLTLIAALSIVGAAGAQVSFGEPVKINDGWSFTLDDPEMEPTEYIEGPRWETVDLPHDWSVKGQLSPTLASATGYLPGGIGWYRKELAIPASRSGEKVYLYFEGVYNRSEVYINGHLLGYRPNGYISFMYDATPYVNFGGENVVTVKVDHSQSADSRWYTGSGIYRDVYMVYSGPVHIAQWGVYVYPEKAEAKQGVLHWEVTIENGSGSASDLTIVNELLSPDGRSVAKSSSKLNAPAGNNGTVSSKITARNVELWDLTSPSLYTLVTEVYSGKDLIDRTSTKTGFRTFTFDPDHGFALNGEWMKMKGVCLHHDAGVLGAAVPKEVWRHRLQTLKELGVNAVRTTHNPQSPDLYDLCDELGLLVIDEAFDEWEFPKRKWLDGWNVGTPGFQGSYDFFEEWGERDLADMVRRDRNHLSVFAWSIGNEVDYPNDPYSHPSLDSDGDFTQATFGGYHPDAPDATRLGGIAKRLAAVVRQYDLSRPVTAGLAGVVMSNETDYPFAVDIAGYNYTEARYGIDHEKYPERVIYGSENRHDYEAWLAVANNEHIFGQFLWTGIDYLGEATPWPSRGFYSGLLDFAGNVKPRGYFHQSLWSDTPMAYIRTYPVGSRGGNISMDAWPVWNYEPGTTVRVVCYTNCEEAYLTLDGYRVGETKRYDTNTGIIYWDIPYQPGKLTVHGLNGDSEVAEYSIRTSVRPQALITTSVDNAISADKGVAFVEIQVVDDNGAPVVLADNMVICTVDGPGKLLGLESGNNRDTSDWTDNAHRVFRGRITAYIQADGPGEITVRFDSPLLEGTAVTILAQE